MNKAANTMDPSSFASELHAVSQAFPKSLFDLAGEGWQRLLARAATVPASFIDHAFGFELRLKRRERVADFCVTVQAGNKTASEFLNFRPDKKYLDVSESEWSTHQDPKRDINAHLGNEALTTLLSEINRQGSFANSCVPSHSVILEYDVVEPRGKNPAPGVFWGLAEHIGSNHMSGVVRMLDMASNPVLSASHSNTENLERLVDDELVASLSRVAEATKPYGRISQVGAFVSRDTSRYRVLIRVENRSAIREILQGIGWLGSIDKAIDVVSKFDSEDVHFGIALDVGKGGVGSRMGLEVSTGGGWFVTRFAHWQPLIDVLVVNDLCFADKAEGLRQWCGYLPLFGRKMCMLLKGINHFKISIRNDKALEAKAYLGACRILAEDVGIR